MALRLVKLDRFELHVTEAQHVDLLTNAMPLAPMEVPPTGLRGNQLRPPHAGATAAYFGSHGHNAQSFAYRTGVRMLSPAELDRGICPPTAGTAVPC